MKVPTDAAPVGGRNAPNKIRLITRQSLDGRTKASRNFETIVNRIAADLGGEITEIERHLLIAFAGSAVMQQHLIAKLLSGQPVDVGEFSNNASSLIRGATRLGTGRRARDLTPTLAEYLRASAPAGPAHEPPESAELGEATAP
jgi:hypothetical protein